MLAWRSTLRADGALVFHHERRPVRMWAVSINPGGPTFHEATIEEITESKPIDMANEHLGSPGSKANARYSFSCWNSQALAKIGTEEDFPSQIGGYRKRSFWSHISAFAPKRFDHQFVEKDGVPGNRIELIR